MILGEDNLSVFHQIYTPEVLSSMAAKANSDDGLKVLHRMLIADNDQLKISRIHFDKCLQFAKQHNGIDADRLARLREPQNYAVWKSVHNELLVPYFFAKVFKLTIKFITDAKARGLGDFQVIHPEGSVVVEVKTPKGDDAFSNGQKQAEYHGYGDEFIKSVFEDAAKQLSKETMNLVIICPQLCTWIQNSKTFVWYLYGKEVMVHEGGKLRTAILPNGELLKHRPPRFTRISSVGSFRIDYSRRSNGKCLPVSFTLFHNYFAKKQIPIDVFDSIEQYVINESTNQITPINRGNCRFVIHE